LTKKTKFVIIIIYDINKGDKDYGR
jgi:hypothetical protein